MNAPVRDLFPEAIKSIHPDDVLDERYTTRETMEWVRKTARVTGFDLDVAACEESHHADRFYTKADDGLSKPWRGRCWCNPPYSDIAPWVSKAWQSMAEGAELVAMLIPATRTEQSWWQTMVEPYRDRRARHPSNAKLETYFLPGRTAFARPGSGGVGQSGAPFGCVLLVWRRRP